MTQAILKTVAQQNPVSFEEVRAAYDRLHSIDAVMVAIELAVLTNRPFKEAIDVICVKSQICSGDRISNATNSTNAANISSSK